MLQRGWNFTFYLLPLIDSICSQEADRKCGKREGKEKDDMQQIQTENIIGACRVSDSPTFNNVYVIV